ncbi:MAG: alpha-L-fucosidase [Terriglobia bacterium]
MGQTCSRRTFLKHASLAGASLAAGTYSARLGRAITAPFPGRFQPTWDSLSQYHVPDWYRDAKFGIFMHWGIYSVPAHASEWYPRLMYRRESPVFQWHQQHWGPQSMFGYKDFIPMFRGERWNPAELVALYKKAGAKYIVPVGEHHDGFPMYDSHLTEWCAAKMGPRRDTIAEWEREVRSQGLRFGVSSHRGFHWSYYTFEDDFDTNNPLYAGLYGPIHAPTPLATNNPHELRQTPSLEFLQDWYARTIEIVDKYHPDLMYFDFGFNIPPFEPYRKQFGAYYYDVADQWGREVVLNYKNKAYPEHAAVLDIERGLVGEVRELPWQTDTSVGWKSWGYIQDENYKSASEIIHEFVDIVSKNGNLLLNVGPKPDGTLPEEAVELFHGLGRWMEVNGSAIFGSRPWKVYAEGPTALKGGSFGESAEKTMKFTSEDIRFTTKDGAIYAILMAWPEDEAKITSLGSKSPHAPGRISNVQILGAGGNLQWRQEPEALTIQVPGVKPCDYAYCFKITV